MLPSGTVTFLFTDIEGSTPLWERSPQAMRASLDQHHTILHGAIEAYGGTVFQIVGDAFCAAFPYPAQAVEAAVTAQRSLEEAEWMETGPLRVRIGIHTGPADLSNGEYRSNHTFNRVERIMSAGHGGQVVVSQEAYELARRHLPEAIGFKDLGEQAMKGMSQTEHLFQVLAPGLRTEFPALKTGSAPRHNLPQFLTPFVGRERELAEIRSRLEDPAVRLVTLIGPGGIGKTRLAIEAAQKLVSKFKDGVYFVDLSPLNDPDLVLSALAQVLGVRESGALILVDELKESLRNREMLLILDNFEQVTTAAHRLADLQASSPSLKILATSREPLRLRGEHQFPLSSLALPDMRALHPLDLLSQYASVELFLQRAQSVKPGFVLESQNAASIVEICTLLDGLPLAIELAAARVKLFSPQALLARLKGDGRREDRSASLQLLSNGPRDVPARQQTLRNAIAWSYDLLEVEEKALFRRLAVFSGGCILKAVEGVCNSQGDLQNNILDLLASLVDKSLIKGDEQEDGEPRFTQLRTIQDYAFERLEASGEVHLLREAHAQFFRSLIDSLKTDLDGVRSQVSVRTLDRLDRELDNLRSALEWFDVSGQAGVGLVMVYTSHQFWYRRGYWSECQHWYGTFLPDVDDLPSKDHSEALRQAGLLAVWQGDTANAKQYLLQSLEMKRELGDKAGIADVLLILGTAIENESTEQRVIYHQESLALAREVGNKDLVAVILNTIGYNLLLKGEYAQAKALLEESLQLCREVGNDDFAHFPLLNLGWIALEQGEFEQADHLVKESLKLLHETGGPPPLIIESFEELAVLSSRQGRAERAARLFGAARSLSEAVGYRLQNFELDFYQRFLEEARTRSDPATWEAAFAEGQAMSLEEAIEYALAE